MEQLSLGDITIALQNEAGRNEDIYMVRGDQFKPMRGKAELERLLFENIEDPERFVVYEEGARLNVYTKQPDAVLSLALFLNREKGTDVSDADVQELREKLIRLQH